MQSQKTVKTLKLDYQNTAKFLKQEHVVYGENC
jgi:hypothetical protein